MTLMLRAFCGLLFYDVLNQCCRFETMYRLAKRWKVAERSSGPEIVDKICRAVDYACVWYPKEALCLQRSFAITSMLRARGVNARLVLGAQVMPFEAHAWVEVDGRAIHERTDVQAIYGVWDRC